MKAAERSFFFRGAADRGVVSHLHKEGYRIRDRAGDRARFMVDAGANIGDETLGFPDGDTEATAIPELMSHFGCREIDILKLDIEGAEAVVIPSGASSWLASVKVLIFECPDHEREGATMAIFRALNECGRPFRCAVHGENIVAIRGDVPWRLESALLLPEAKAL